MLRAVLSRALLVSLVAASVYAAWLDLSVQARFEGRRWTVPARIYGRSMELYPGMPVSAEDLQEELRSLGYRAVPGAPSPASYSRRGKVFRVHTRTFRFFDSEEPARKLTVELGTGSLSRLRSGGRDLALQRLDPPLIGRIYPGHNEDRVLLRLEEVPTLLMAALLSVEDRDFLRHHGVSPRAIARAMMANLRAGAVVQGGSTLTQQLAKSYFLSGERTWWRKLNDALIAILLEAHYDKRDILEAYVNEVYLGQDGRRAIHGFGLASQFYFGRPLEDLRLAEFALLVAVVRGPSYYNPRRHPQRARERRDRVLDQMMELEVIDAAEAARAKASPLTVTATPRPTSRYPAFVDLVRRQLRRDYREEDLREEGLRIFTTFDPRAQRTAEKALAQRIRSLERYSRTPKGALQGAVIVTSPQSGEVLAVVGGRDPRQAGFNRALDAVRPVGSLIKPAVYLAALERPSRYTLATPLMDEPVTLRSSKGQLWQPTNYDDQVHGRVPLYEALVKSYNLATVRLGMDVGLDRVVESLRRLGVQRPVKGYPSLLLGAAELAPVEVTQMYQTLAGGGFRVPLRAIREVTSARGEPLSRYPLSVDQAFEPGPVFLVVEAMRGVMTLGTGRSARARLGPRLVTAGKTGSTDGLRDSWFAGFGDDVLAVVWLGHDDNTPVGLSGAGGALQVWIDMMKGLRPRSLSAHSPEGIEWVWTDLQKGLATDGDCPGAASVPYMRGSAPAYGSCAGLRAGRAEQRPG